MFTTSNRIWTNLNDHELNRVEVEFSGSFKELTKMAKHLKVIQALAFHEM